MKKLFLFIAFAAAWSSLSAAIDMQAHQDSDEGRAAYSTYKYRQKAYYTGNYRYSQLLIQDGQDLFGSLNALMGNTSKIASSAFSYDGLRYAYKSVDRDLNTTGNIISYYDGSSFAAVWDKGATWNREHTWPQSKGANKDIPMGHDMQSVRPAKTDINEERGSTAYGESGGFYNPDNISINNPNYKSTNNGTYRGDCARVIMYDYIVYGSNGTRKNALFNGQAQLLSKLGKSGVFESLEVLLKWHMQDPPSLTEMVRNDGGQTYQGNRNPFIDYPEFAIQIFKDNLTTYTVSSNQPMNPNYQLTTKHGFVTYLYNKEGNGHPAEVTVSGAKGNYDKITGRLTVTNVTGAMKITTDTPYELPEDEPDGLWDTTVEKIEYFVSDNILNIKNLTGQAVGVYSIDGQCVYLKTNVTENVQIGLTKGAYLLRVGSAAAKVIVY